MDKEFVKLCQEIRAESGTSIRETILYKLRNLPKNSKKMKKDEDAIVWSRKTLFSKVLK